MKALIRVPRYGLARLTDDLLWEADDDAFEQCLNADHPFDPDRYTATNAAPGSLELADVLRRFGAAIIGGSLAPPGTSAAAPDAGLGVTSDAPQDVSIDPSPLQAPHNDTPGPEDNDQTDPTASGAS